jgi:hypothetical protein
MKEPWKSAIRFGILLAAFGLPRAIEAQTCGGGAQIAISKTADLNFGTLSATTTAGTAVIDPATGNRTVTGGVVAVGGAGFSAAAFSVLLCGAAGPKRFNVILPSSPVMLTGSSGGTMSVDTFTRSPAGNISSDTSPPPTPFTVGATLHVGANQTQGTYTGIFNVTVVRQ